LNTNLKYGIGLAVTAILMGVFAGILVVTMDLYPLLNYWWIIFGILAGILALLIFIAYKKGRIPIREWKLSRQRFQSCLLFL
jgi:hypothetical protein